MFESFILFNIIANDLERVMECTLIKQSGETVDRLEDRAAI